MATQYERALIQHLTITDSLQIIADEDIPSAMIPSEDLRPVWDFAIDYWHNNDPVSRTAPSPEAMILHFENLLAEHKIDVTIEPEDALPWALDVLKGAWIDRSWQEWTRKFAGQMAGADLLAKSTILDDAISEMMVMQRSVARRGEYVDVRFAFERSVELYHERRALREAGIVDGAILGLPMIDTHMLGTRPGELTIIGAGPKTGKSFLLLWAAWSAWLAGKVPTLVTLENTVDMTLDRLACMVLGIDYAAWQEGLCTTEEMEMVQEWLRGLAQAERPFHVIQPEPGKRNIDQLLRRSRAQGDILYLDQLTFLEHPRHLDKRAKTEQIGASLHECKASITSGYSRHAVVMAHQINREGVRAARAAGRLLMEHFADSAEIERTADFAFGLWQSSALRDIGRAWFQTLAARRTDNVDWELTWRPWIGHIEVRGQIEIPDGDD